MEIVSWGRLRTPVSEVLVGCGALRLADGLHKVQVAGLLGVCVRRRGAASTGVLRYHAAAESAVTTILACRSARRMVEVGPQRARFAGWTAPMSWPTGSGGGGCEAISADHHPACAIGVTRSASRRSRSWSR